MGKVGVKDPQTVMPGGARAGAPNIEGVQIHELGNVLTRSGHLTEIFRTDWPFVGIEVRQINWVQLNPGAVTDWHMHARQNDHLIGISGTIKLALWDGRAGSRTQGATDLIRFGALRPVMAIVPPGVWHGLRNESGAPAGYINVIDELYNHAEPDNWRATLYNQGIPDIL
jgi:dTDP-4-dehydrorhamnose 3,5-epimerase